MEFVLALPESALRFLAIVSQLHLLDICVVSAGEGTAIKLQKKGI